MGAFVITAKSFLALEASLTDRLVKALSLITKEIYSKVNEALASGDVDKAVQQFDKVSLSDLFERQKDYVSYITNMAMLFGASRVTQQPGTSVVGLGFEKMTAEQMNQNFKQMVMQKGEAYLKTVGRNYLDGLRVTKAEGPVLRSFQSFMNDAGEAFMNIAASLHTSRVSAYGFTAEAMALGLEEYQINEQLDAKTCPVCRHMHGKRFKVKDARRLLDIVTRVVDPDDLKALQPWPKQSKAAMASMKKMNSKELVANGWHIPPFHPRCRGLLARVGKVPTLEQISEGTVQEKYVAIKEDFKALKVSCNDAQLKLWNEMVGLNPGEVIARLTGRSIDDFFVGLHGADNPKEYAGIYAFSMAKNIKISLTKEGFGSSQPFDQAVMVKTKDKSLYLDAIELHEEDQGAGVVKKFMREFYTLAKDMGLKKMELVAGLDMGGYAWAKYGFKPTAESWEALKKDVQARYVKEGLSTTLSKAHQEAFKKVMASDDVGAIYTLSDLPFGKQLLAGQLWEGALDLDDAEAVTRFLTYIGELK